jgi:hypothetical protein
MRRKFLKWTFLVLGNFTTKPSLTHGHFFHMDNLIMRAFTTREQLQYEGFSNTQAFSILGSFYCIGNSTKWAFLIKEQYFF